DLERLAPEVPFVHRAVAENIGPRTDEDGWEHYAYKLEVTFRRRKMTMDWKHGLGVTDYPEDVPTHILDAMVSDYWTWKNANGYEDYCSEFGLEGSREDYRSWEQLGRFAEDVEDLLGAVLLEDLRDNYERL